MNFKTYEDLTNCIVNNLYKIPRNIDLIVGIPRSGIMAASILALYLNLPFTDVDNFLNCGALKTGNTRKCKDWIRKVEDARHILVVDDSISSGKAMEEVKIRFREKGVVCESTFLAIYALWISCKKVDLYFELCEQPRMFEWNYMHHWGLEYCCIDMDGIIYENNPNFQCDNDEAGTVLSEGIKPKLIPTQKIGYLIADCSEAYKEQIESWLRKYNIDYEYLMVTKKKGEIYKKSKCVLFFENDYNEALEICKISGKPVFCLSERRYITSDSLYDNVKNRKREVSITVNRVVKKIMHKVNYVE